MLELLAPAGSMEALRAAVQNGANAVYLGSGSFNARQGAKNFTPQMLTEAVKYCHVRGVQVHLTLNTLVSDRETSDVCALIRHAANADVDAFIVQDLHIVQLCKQIAPHVPIHGSTQLTVHSLPGVLFCAALGMSRVVLSRELGRDEIGYICQNSPIEIEVFAHGALCMCYSGQCYLSAAIGGRSGNRGRCAQPCRQSYGYGRWEDKYPLSLKDSCLLLIAWLAKKSEHILLVCLDARLVEWVNVNHVTADTASLLEEIEESSEVVLIDTLDRNCNLRNAAVDVSKLGSELSHKVALLNMLSSEEIKAVKVLRVVLNEHRAVALLNAYNSLHKVTLTILDVLTHRVKVCSEVH